MTTIIIKTIHKILLLLLYTGELHRKNDNHITIRLCNIIFTKSLFEVKKMIFFYILDMKKKASIRAF